MDQDLELRHLRYFVAVAEELHFARAAERLNMSQPPLSMQIRRLEEFVGYPLFARTSRSVKLTPAGETLLERARRALRNVERDINDVRNVGAGEVGTLNIGFVGSAMLTALPEIFSKFRRDYPGVRLRLYESFTSQVLEGLENGTLDAGILRDSDPVNSLNVTELFTEPYGAVIPARHRYAKKKSVAPAMLRDEPFVYYPRSAGARAFEKPLSMFEEHGFRPQIVQEGVALDFDSSPGGSRDGRVGSSGMRGENIVTGSSLPPHAACQSLQQPGTRVGAGRQAADCGALQADRDLDATALERVTPVALNGIGNRVERSRLHDVRQLTAPSHVPNPDCRSA